MGLEIFTLRERPDLRPLIFGSELDSVLPEFMRPVPVAHLYFAPSILDHYLDYEFAGVAGGKVVARAFSVPFAFHIDGRAELPDGGWDEVIRWAHDDRMTGRAPNALSALEISLLPEARGGGNSPKPGGLPKCSRRCGRTRSIFIPSCRCANTSARWAPMACRPTPGCEPTFAPGQGS